MKFTLIIWLTLGLGALTGCQSSSPLTQVPAKPVAFAPLVARFYLETRPGESVMMVQLPQSGVRLGVAPKPVFSEYDISDAEVAKVELGPCVLIELTPAATRDLYRLSVPAQGRRLVMVLNDEFLGVHRIEHAMADGAMPVFLEVSDAQLPSIVARIKFTAAEIARVAAKATNQ
jgi:hypothetical protein